MTLIKIVKGTFGYKVGFVVKNKTVKDDPFEVDKSIADRLIAAGIAVRASDYKAPEAAGIEKVNLAPEPVKKTGEKAQKTAPPAAAQAGREASFADGESTGTKNPKGFDEADTKDVLVEFAAGWGITLTKSMSKPQMLELLEAEYEKRQAAEQAQNAVTPPDDISPPAGGGSTGAGSNDGDDDNQDDTGTDEEAPQVNTDGIV